MAEDKFTLDELEKDTFSMEELEGPAQTMGPSLVTSPIDTITIEELEPEAAVAESTDPRRQPVQLFGDIAEQITAAKRGAETLMAPVKALSPVALPFHATVATLADSPELLKQAWQADIRWGTGEGQAAAVTWPSHTELRRRMQAVKWVQENSGPGQRFALEDLEDPVMREFLYDLRMAEIVEEEEKDAFTLSISGPVEEFIRKAVPDPILSALGITPDPLTTPLQKAIDNYIQQYKQLDGTIPPHVGPVIERVRGLLREQGYDETVDTAMDVVVKRGLPMVGADLAIEALDPMWYVAGVGKPRGVQPFTLEDEARRVGILPVMSHNAEQLAKMTQELESTTPVGRAVTQMKAGLKKQAAAAKVGIDPDIARDAQKMIATESDVVRSTRQTLARHTMSEDMTDAVLYTGLSGHGGKTQARTMRQLIDKTYPNISEKAATKKLDALMRDTKPLRAWRKYLKSHYELVAAQSSHQKYTALRKVYEETLSHQEDLKIMAAWDMAQLGADWNHIEKVLLYPSNTDLLQKWARGMGKLNRADKKTFRELTRMIPDNEGKLIEAGAGFWGMLAEPRQLFRGTRMWESLDIARKGRRDFEFHWGTRATDEFGHLLDEAVLDEKIGMALDGKMVESFEDGSARFIYAIADDTGAIIDRRPVRLSAEEMTDYRNMRQVYDEIADDIGVPPGDRIIGGYMPRLYKFDKPKGAVRYEIPIDMSRDVNNSIYFAHLQDRKWIEALAKEKVAPRATEALRLYIRGAARKKYLEPALAEADEFSKSLDKLRQDRWQAWKKRLKGQPDRASQLLDETLNRAATKLTGKYHDWHPATKAALLWSRLAYYGILGGHIGSGMVNLTQSLNTVATTGPFHTLRGWAYFRTPEGKKLADKMRLTDDFVEFLEKPNPILTKIAARTGGTFKSWDDLILSPMLLAENFNRGVAFWSGISLEMEKAGIKNLKQFLASSDEIKDFIIKQGVRTAEETQFIYGVNGLPPALSGGIGKTVTTLGTFAPKQAAFIVNTFKNDPTGILRLIATSGLFTRFARENMGLSAEEIVGFGFIPNTDMPFASPQIQTLVHMAQIGMSNDPFDRAHAQQRFFTDLANLIPGPGGAGVPFVPGAYVEAGGVPMGSRSFRNWVKLTKMYQEGALRGHAEALKRPLSLRELPIKAMGLRTEEERSFAKLIADVNRESKELSFARRDLINKMMGAFVAGDYTKFFNYYDEGLDKQIITETEMGSYGLFNRLLQEAMMRTQVPLALRLMMEKPELLITTPGLQERLQQFQ